MKNLNWILLSVLAVGTIGATVGLVTGKLTPSDYQSILMFLFGLAVPTQLTKPATEPPAE